MIYSLLGFYLNWRAYDFFGEGHPRRWEVTLTRTTKRLSTDEDYTIKEEFAGEVAWLFIVIKTRILHNNLKLERKYNMVLSIVINCHDMFKLIR